MVPEQCVKVRWNGRSKKYYESLGYNFTKMHSLFWVDIKDVLKGSNVELVYMCDYCGDYALSNVKEYYSYKEKFGTVNKDACGSCIGIKTAESNQIVYGVDNVSQIPETIDKIKQTHMKNSGVINASQRSDHAEKIRETSLRVYGVENYAQSPRVINKRRKTNLIRYGHINAAQNPEIRKKINNTFRKNGTVPTSKPQRSLYEMLKNNGYKVVLNHPVFNFYLDVALYIGDIKIAVEYDGWYWHQDQDKDRRRDEFLKTQGWKILRVKSGRFLPTISELAELIDLLKTSKSSYREIKLEDWLKNEAQSS